MVRLLLLRLQLRMLAPSQKTFPGSVELEILGDLSKQEDRR